MFSGNSNTSVNKIRYYFSFIMAGLYAAIGLGFLFTDMGIQMFPVYRQAVGGILLVYSIFRLFMIVKRKRAENSEA